MLGWRDFDQVAAAGIAARQRSLVRTDPGGWMACPLVAHDAEPLPWRKGSHRLGTVSHGFPAASFRISPTYVLDDPLDNFLVGRSLAEQLITDGRKAETHRLGYENSEDALTFNVFRMLQEVGRLEDLAEELTGYRTTAVRLFLWGLEITSAGRVGEWPELELARSRLEPRPGQKTEPDVCLHVPGWGWVFIEAKFGSPASVPVSDAKHSAWLDAYMDHAAGVLDPKAVYEIPRREFPEQLLRNLLMAHAVRKPGERAMVVALGRARERSAAAVVASSCVVEASGMRIAPFTWERIYDACEDQAGTATLRRYLEGKRYRLRPAFDLHGSRSHRD